MTANEIVPVPFHGEEIPTVEVDGRPHLFLRPTLESIGIDPWTQIEKLRSRSWACTSQSLVQLPGDTQRRQHTTVDVRTFLMLLATIDERRVPEDVRPKLIAYQAEVADVIESYWTRGGAINPRATDDQLAAIIDRAEAQARVLQAVRGLVDGRWLEAKARHVTARALGEEPEIDPDKRPLTVGEYLEDQGVPAAAARSMASQFGKRLKAAYVAANGVEPPKVDRFIEGAIRRVQGYTEADRPLFDQVWETVTAPASA